MTSNDISTPKKAESAPRQALELLADYLEAERDEPAAVYLTGRAETARLEDARAALFSLDPAALLAQAEADRGLHTLAVQARDARTSADRRAALDALERAALALGGTP